MTVAANSVGIFCQYRLGLLLERMRPVITGRDFELTLERPAEMGNIDKAPLEGNLGD